MGHGSFFMLSGVLRDSKDFFLSKNQLTSAQQNRRSWSLRIKDRNEAYLLQQFFRWGELTKQRKLPTAIGGAN